MTEWNSDGLLFKICMGTSLLLDISSAMLNGLIAYVLKKYKKTNIVTFWFLYCLSFSDVFVGITGLLFHSLDLTLSPDSPRPFWSLAKKVADESFDYFLATSGHLIFIIAIDRCIHMKFLHMYNTIMTQRRARWIMLLNIVVAMLLLPPPFLLEQDPARLFHFCVNIFYTLCTLVIYVVYIMVYLLIRKQVMALQLGKLDRMASEDNAKKDSDCRGRPLDAHHRIECAGTEEGNENMNKPGNSKPIAFKSDDILQSQNKVLILADCNAPNTNKLLEDTKNPNDSKSIAKMSHSVENATTHPVVETNISTGKLVTNRKRTEMQISNTQNNQKQLRIRSKTEHEFRKATLLILFALFFCYFPRFIHRFYLFATQDRNHVHFAISNVGVLLNSSLNAAILIACSKEIRKYIRALLIAWLGKCKAKA